MRSRALPGPCRLGCVPLPLSEREGGVLLCLLQHPPPHAGSSMAGNGCISRPALDRPCSCPCYVSRRLLSLKSSKAWYCVQAGLISSALSVAMCGLCYQRILGQNPSPGRVSHGAIGPESWDVGPMCSMCVQLPLL